MADADEAGDALVYVVEWDFGRERPVHVTFGAKVGFLMTDDRRGTVEHLAVVVEGLATAFAREKIGGRAADGLGLVLDAEQGEMGTVVENVAGCRVFDVNPTWNVVDNGAQEIAFFREFFLGDLGGGDVA